MSLGQKMVKYFGEAKEELQKVSWPTKKETTNHTLLVVGISVGVLIFFGIVDYFLTIGLEQLITRK